MNPKTVAGNIKLIGGALCLDFLNTVHCYGGKDRGDYLNTYQDLVAWSRHVDTISTGETKALLQRADHRTEEGESVLRDARELREVIYRIFTTELEDKPPARKDLAVFNDYLARAMKSSQIIKTADGFYWDMTSNKADLGWILNPVIRSAADLLISEEFSRIKKCADPVCGWLFLDVSRNRSRRWCDMRDCGNRAKASRFYKRKKGTKPRKPPSQVSHFPPRSRSNLERHLL